MMKYLTILIVLLIVNACQKEPLTKPVFFTETTYESLGAFDTTGKPAYLEKSDIISSNIVTLISQTLPERQDLRKTKPDLLSTKEIADISLTQKSNIFITYLHEGTTNTNALGFYTYPTQSPPATAEDIKKITYIFPNGGNGTPLRAGDKVKIGAFDPGMSIGFVLLQNGWNNTTNNTDSKVVHFCSNDALNPEVDPNLKKHAVLIKVPTEDKVLIGFEDINRTFPVCDHDFNDVMIYATVTPQ